MLKKPIYTVWAMLMVKPEVQPKGEARERAQIIKNLYLKKKLEISKIAELIDLPETDVLEVINQVNK